ncbi:hypothetical protein LOAG_06834, partial [Loa loa]
SSSSDEKKGSSNDDESDNSSGPSIDTSKARKKKKKTEPKGKAAKKAKSLPQKKLRADDETENTTLTATTRAKFEKSSENLRHNMEGRIRMHFSRNFLAYLALLTGTERNKYTSKQTTARQPTRTHCPLVDMQAFVVIVQKSISHIKMLV